jgi:hypothetical protein
MRVRAGWPEVAMAERDDGGFLSRWSRRKAGLKEVPATAAPLAPAPPVRAERVEDPVPADPVPAAPPAPTLDDVAELTAESDFTRFAARDVDPGVRNAAMKKLFADPHFNVMDGLDTYIGDYNTFEPVPRQLLRQLANARVLGLLDDELEEQPRPDNPLPDENAAVQLQPDDAARPEGAERSAGRADDDPHDPVPPRGA